MIYSKLHPPPPSRSVNVGLKKTPKRKHPDENRSRTPSGQIISTSVDDIRNSIEAKARPEKIFKPNKDRNGVQREDRLTTSESVSKEDQSGGTATSLEFGHDHDHHDNSEQQTPLKDKVLTPDVLLFAHTLTQQLNEMKENSSRLCSHEEGGKNNSDVLSGIECEIDAKIKDLSHSQESISSDTPGDGNHKVMDVRTVIQMFEELKVDISEKIKNVQAKEQNSTATRIQEMERKLRVGEAKERMIIGTMSRMQDLIGELQRKNENVEAQNAKKMVILSGFEGSQKKHVFVQQLHEFIQDEIGVKTKIEDVFFIGQGQPREVVIQFNSVTDKRDLFQNKHRIKNLVNAHGQKYFFREYRMQKQAEVKRRFQEMSDDMAEEEPVDRKDVVLKGSQIIVGEEYYVKKVVPPDPTKVLQLSMPELNRIIGSKVHAGPVLDHKGNRFTTYSIDTNSFDHIETVYMKLRLDHAAERHIVCAWNIPGKDKFHCEDGCDDDEYGAAAAMLGVLKQNKIVNRAVFIARKCGEKLGKERLACYTQLTRAVIKARPSNELSGEVHHVAKEDENQELVEEPRVSNNPIFDQLPKRMTFAGAVKNQEKQVSRKEPSRGRGAWRRGWGRGTRGGRRGRGVGNTATNTTESKRTYIPRPDAEFEKPSTDESQNMEM